MKKCCVIGHPVSHSLSPAMHNAGYKALGLDFEYMAIDVEPDDLACFVKRLRTGEFVGCSVTIPHKIAVMDYVNVLTPEASSIGAVNTLYCDGDKLIGDNTDWYGIHASLKELMRYRKKKILVYGAGGAARACLHALQELNAEVFVTNRSMDKGIALANDFGANFVEPCDLPKDINVFVNATSVGLPGNDQMLVSEEWLRKVDVVFDMVYPNTMLSQTAERLHCKVIPGLKMLLYQGARQFELFTGEEAPVRDMARAIGI